MDLSEFACRTVNASFAVATANYNVSDFSPPLTIEIHNKPGKFKAKIFGAFHTIFYNYSMKMFSS